VERAYAMVDAADALLVAGSSLTVQSGLRFVRHAAQTGKPVVVVNRGATRGDKYAAVTLVGPLAREVFARFSAIDLRPRVTPVLGFRPGSVARTPGMVVREGEERFLLLFGWALGAYVWETVTDAGTHLGGSPVGADALEQVAIGMPSGPIQQEASRA